MTNLIEVLPYLAPYKFSFGVLALLCMAVLLQAFLTAPLAFITGEQTPGMPLRHDHSFRSFRVLRAYANSTENLPALGFTLLVAIVAGVSPTWVNWLVGIHFLFRLAFWGVYFSGIGRVAGGPRTLAYVGGLVSNMILAGMAIWSIFTAAS